MARPRTAKDRAILEAMWDPLRAMLTSTAATLIELAAREAQPDIPASIARHLSAPQPTSARPIAYLSDDGGAG